MTTELLGLQEIADLAGVTASAVANWRRRFPDFPAPVVELKSGPVFAGPAVRVWLSRRDGTDLAADRRFYDRLAAARGDDNELVLKVNETVEKLVELQTSASRPGMLLGKVQSGKTRAFLGVIARSFDRGVDVAVVLTKGTKSLVKQTISRLQQDFGEFIRADELQVFDIMSLPVLTKFELDQKLVFVVKKEDDNLRRLLAAFESDYEALRKKRVLIVDDEADLGSVSFSKRNGVVHAGKLSTQIDALREIVPDLDYLQVTATPYSLYLQPDADLELADGTTFKPKRPAFTVVLPTHGAYVGGDVYFGQDADETSPAYYFYREVPEPEREALKNEDGRRLKLDDVLGSSRAVVLRDAILAFVVGAVIRRIQARDVGAAPQKYSFLFHTEQSRSSHEWQERVVNALRDALVRESSADSPRFNELLARSIADLGRSVRAAGGQMPDDSVIKRDVLAALSGGQLMITRVNSDKEIEELLDESGQLKLRTPMNVFIGGQILDRGVTINNLLAFYYGRNPKRFQQDTVLQHSRMYGVRPYEDLAVTRFYAPLHVYQVLRKINAFDGALRAAFESGAHDRGVYFIQRDAQNRIIPCSPNKLLLSDVSTVRPGERLLPVGFNTVSRSAGRKPLEALDAVLDGVLGVSPDEPRLISVEAASDILVQCYGLLDFDEASDSELRAHVATLEHLSMTARQPSLQGKVWIFGARDRRLARKREEGRYSNAPDTKQQALKAHSLAADVPVLVLLRQDGREEDGWRGLPFWWPVIVTPTSAPTTVFAVPPAPQEVTTTAP